MEDSRAPDGSPTTPWRTPRTPPATAGASAPRDIETRDRALPDLFGPPPYSRSPLDGGAHNADFQPLGPFPGHPGGAPFNPVPQVPHPVGPPGMPLPYMPPYPYFRAIEPPKGLATASLVLGICGLSLSIICFILPYIAVVLSVIALLTGAAALNKCSRNTGSGKGMAIAGVVMGACGILIGVFGIIIIIRHSVMYP